ncbi:MAG TPA: hypothetical protein VGQ47_03455 [Candidatus Limnocylindrales bacterium]|nr:hypothetical protein [Candidatus Limnocylindrales bacterium]
MKTLARTTRRAALAITAALLLTLFAASAVAADDGEWYGDGGFTLSTDLSLSTSDGLRLGIRWD